MGEASRRKQARQRTPSPPFEVRRTTCPRTGPWALLNEPCPSLGLDRALTELLQVAWPQFRKLAPERKPGMVAFAVSYCNGTGQVTLLPRQNARNVVHEVYGHLPAAAPALSVLEATTPDASLTIVLLTGHTVRVLEWHAVQDLASQGGGR